MTDNNFSAKTRFCPSPTGYMHVGNARTALFNALAAYAAKGKFLLRIEDTDQERSKPEYVSALKQDLHWLGCDWQEGPDQEGSDQAVSNPELQANGPYFQSERLAIYEQFYQQLIEQKLAYRCFCTEAELAQSRKRLLRMNKPPRYLGTCRHLTPEQIAEKEAADLKSTLRFALPENEIIEFDDLVRGKQKFNSSDLGDFIIRKTDGMPTFMFCNAIDDALMGVTIALRGEDHLTNTPRQLFILKALGLTPPQYGHISLITGDDNAPLSKRNGSQSIAELRQTGYLPMALVNYLARLGHVYTDHSELMSMQACATHFSLTKLVKAPARYDDTQLLHWQKLAVLAMDMPQFKNWLMTPELSLNLSLDQVPADKLEQFFTVIKPNVMLPSEVTQWANDLFSTTVNYAEQDLSVLRSAGELFFTTCISALQQPKQVDYHDLCELLKTQIGVKGKKLFMPLRLAMTQQAHGPELPLVYDLLGREFLLQRFETVRACL